MTHRPLPLLALLLAFASAPVAQTADSSPPAATPALDGGLVCVLQVADLDRAITWYRDNLGFTLLWSNPQIGFAEMATRSAEARIGLSRHQQPSVEPGVVLTFGVHDIKQAEAALKAKGVATEPISTYPDLVHLMLLRDADGNTLQLYQSLQPPPPAAKGLEQVAFLAGSWVRIDGPHRSEEHWTAPVGGMMVGMSRIVRDGKAVFFEAMRIERDADGAVVYHAMPGGRPGTAFRLRADLGAENKVVFENPEHDFPQRVLYWLDHAGDLRARIEGDRDGKPQHHDFHWRRGSLR